MTLLAACLIAGLAPGCGQVQIAPEHRDLVLRLATATSTRDEAILHRAAADIDRLAAEGTLANQEQAAFRLILDAAHAGDWDRAQRLAYTLRDGQRPTAEEQQRVAQRTVRTIKKLEAPHPQHRRGGGD